MTKLEKDQEREHRIDMEIVVDAYDREERAMGWYYYVSENCHFPFKAKCTVERRTSPLNLNDEVDVVDTGIHIDDQTNEVINDWHYWSKREYEF